MTVNRQQSMNWKALLIAKNWFAVRIASIGIDNASNVKELTGLYYRISIAQTEKGKANENIDCCSML